MYSGTHPRPSSQNVEATKHIVELSRGISAEDLVLVIISGGGSSLLCYPESECADNDRLYQDFLSTGAPIQELNLVRKHLSLLKGGGLAKMFYPAKIVGLIFCDVPGGHSNLVASGPTFKDVSTAEEADAILTKYNIRDHYNLTETPKEDIFFENVLNITLASNELALNAMKKQAGTLGYSAKIISSEIYDDMDATLAKLQQETSVDVVLAGGEPSLIIKTSGGSGGRNQYLTLKALRTIKQNELMIGIASDGIDYGPMAGAIADSAAKEATTAAGLDIDEHIYRYDAQTFFEKTKKEYNLGGSYSLRTSFFNKELNTCLLEYSYIFVSYNPKNPSLNGMFKIDYIIDVYSGKRLVMNNYDKVDNKDEPTIIFEGKEYGNNYNEARDNLFK